MIHGRAKRNYDTLEASAMHRFEVYGTQSRKWQKLQKLRICTLKKSRHSTRNSAAAAGTLNTSRQLVVIDAKLAADITQPLQRTACEICPSGQTLCRAGR